MWTLLLWIFRVALLALLYLVLWKVVRASVQSLGVRSQAGGGVRQTEEVAGGRTDVGRETPVVIALSKRAELDRGEGTASWHLLVLDHPGGGAPRGKRDVYATGEEIPVYPPFRMGRMAGCDVIMRDRYSSGIHARVYEHGTTLHVEDLGSTNGTYVNGTRVARKASIEDGDVLQIGETSFLLKR